MTDRDALLAAVTAAPNDNLPRRVYADWLEENGEADRAEFIRVQCRLAGADEDDPATWADRRRERDLLSRHGAAWSAPVPVDRFLAPFERGFVRRVAASPGVEVLDAVRAVLAASPGPIELTWQGRDLQPLGGLLNGPEAGKVDALALQVSESGIRHLVELGARTGLRRLALRPDSGRSRARGRPLDGLIFARAFPELRSLSLRGWGLGDADGRQVAAGHWGRLETLDLSENRLTRDFLNVTGPALSRLKALHLDDNPLPVPLRASPAGGASMPLEEVHWEECRLADDTARPALASPSLSRVTRLHLSRNGLNGAGLPDGTPWPHLRELALAGNPLTDRAVRAWVAARQTPPLSGLDLAWTRLTPKMLARLCSWPGLAGVSRLNLGNNPLGPKAVEALNASEHLARLRHLNLSHCGARDGVAALAGGGLLPRLLTLDLSHNGITARGANELAFSSATAGLCGLDLTGNLIGDGGAIALADSPHLPNLQRLQLDREPLDRRTVRRLQDRFGDAVEFS